MTERDYIPGAGPVRKAGARSDTDAPSSAGLSRGTPLLLSIGVSTFGDGLRYAALPLVVALAGGSAQMLGVLLAAGTVPFLIMGVFGGALVDRSDRAQVIRVADLVRFALALGFAALLLLDVSGGWVFTAAVVLALGMGLGEAIVFPAVFALTPTVVAPTHLQRSTRGWSRCRASVVTCSVRSPGRHWSGWSPRRRSR